MTDAPREPAQLLLTGRVGTDITAAGLDKAIFDIGPHTPLRITLRSVGGDVLEASAIYGRLREHATRCHVTIVAAGVFSAGTWLFLAGDRRIVARNATVGIHGVVTNTIAEGLKPSDLRAAAAKFENIIYVLRDIYAERTGLSIDHVQELIEAEASLRAERAVELGFAHEIGAEIW